LPTHYLSRHAHILFLNALDVLLSAYIGENLSHRSGLHHPSATVAWILRFGHPFSHEHFMLSLIPTHARDSSFNGGSH
jgi:hypothetical protein